MADITKQDLQDLTDAISNLARNSGNGYKNSRSGYTGSSSSNLSAGEKALLLKNRELAKSVDSVVGAMSKSDKEFNNMYKATKDVAEQTRDLAANFKSMAAWIALVGTATTSAVNAINSSIDTYRDMSNVGQTFTGSMMKMQMAAADAALPLADFAKLVKDNAMAAAVLGTKGLGDMSKGLRASLREFDMLNLTTQDLNDYLSEYTETQRLYGNLQNLNQHQATLAMKDLALETTKMSQMTGKNRMDIMRSTAQALRDDSLISLQLMNGGKNLEGFNSATQKAMTHLAGLPGEAGTLLSNMFAQTVGRGSAELSDASSDLIKGGMYGINSLMNQMAEQVKKGEMPDMEKFRDRFIAEAKQNMAAIKWQADTGNQYAKKIVGMVGQLANLQDEALEDWKKQNAITSTVMKLQDTFNNFSGFLRTKFFTAIQEIFTAFDNSKLKPELEALGAKFSDLADRFGAFLTRVFSPENVLAMGTRLTTLLDAIGDVGSAIGTVAKPIINTFTWVHENFGLLGTAAAGLVAYLGVKGIGGVLGGFMSRIQGGLNEKFNVGHGIDGVRTHNGAMKVWVVNGGAGMGGGGGGGGRGRYSGRGGRWSGPRTPAPSRGGFFSRAASGIGRALKGGGSLLSRMPIKAGIGGLAAMGAGQLLDSMPDFTGKGILGAGANIAGLASTGAMIGSVVPGIGTAIGGVLGGITGGVMELYNNWDTLSAEASSIVSGVGSSVRSAVTGTISTVGGALSSVGKGFGSFFSWAKDAVTPSSGSVMGNILGSLPLIGDSFKGAASDTSVSGATTPSVSGGVGLDAMVEQFKQMQANQAALTAENVQLRQTMTKIMELLADNNTDLRAGLLEQIAELRKGNRNTKAMADNAMGI